MSTQQSQNTFEKGLVRDQLHSLTDAGTYQYALNAVMGNKDSKGVFTNEEGTKFCGGSDNIVGMSHLDEKNATILFKEGGDISLFFHDDCTEKKVFNASEFGCDFQLGGCEWHDIETKVQGSDCQETMVYFSSKCEYYWFNLDEMCDPDRKNGLKERLADEDCGCVSGCDYFKVFQCACAPKLNAQSFKTGGGSLAAGSYQFVARLINQDGGETNWFHLTQPVHIGSEHNEAGEPSNGHIELQLSCVDCRYSYVELAVIERIGGVLNTKLLDRISAGTNGETSYNYTGSQGDPISIEEILVKGNTFIQGKYLEQRDGRMFYYGIRPRKNLNYQYLANQITSEFIEYEIPLEQACKLQVKSFKRGESYAFGIVWNYKDGTSSPVFHIPGKPGSGTSDVGSGDPTNGDGPTLGRSLNANDTGTIENVVEVGSASGATESQSSSYGIKSGTGTVKRTRGEILDGIENPQNDEYDDLIEQLVDSFDTEIQDVCSTVECDEQAEAAQCCNCGADQTITVCTETTEPDENGEGGGTESCATVSVPAGEPCPSCGAATESCNADLPTVEDISAKWTGLLADYGLDELKPTNFDPTTIKESAQNIIEAVQNRERTETVGREYTVSKDQGTYTQGTQSNEIVNTATGESTKGSIKADQFHDCCGNSESEVKFTVLNKYASKPKIEKGLKYPCTIDCNGNPIYGTLAGSEVCHHTAPENCESPFYLSNSLGVPSVMTPDADEYSDGYSRPLGVRFNNIQLPSIDETSIPICDTNPYTIVMVKRCDKNKTHKLSGVAFGTYQGENNGKLYEVGRHGANSPETVNAFLDTGGQFPRLQSGAADGQSHLVFSLDGCTRQPNLQGTKLKHELELKGQGFKHLQYAKGEEPEDSVKGSRVDNKGTVQQINLNKRTPASCSLLDIDFTIYAPADSTVSPPEGSQNRPLLNKGQQEAIWVGSSLGQKKDSSFTGVVLEHSTPIANAEGDYVTFVEERDIQYGDLTNLQYIPILQAGKNNKSGSIEGLGGDVFIGPWSFVRTSQVSDRVGSCDTEDNKFNIPAMVPIKNQRRCICDDPEDAIHSLAGQWIWSDLPQDGDAADPKNWAGTHTTISARTDTWDQAGGSSDVSNAPRSDFYYPKTLKTMFTVWGEWEVNPWLLQRGKELNEQRPNNLKHEYRLHSGSDIEGGQGWKDAYLNQYYCETVQPSVWKRALKALIRTVVSILMPMWGISNALDITNGVDIVSNIAEFPLLAAMWYFINQTLYTNGFVDKLLGIPVCKSDDKGGGNSSIRRFFTNYCNYNWDYSADNDLQVHFGIPDTYITCDCDDCLSGQQTNDIYYSDRQIQNSKLDSYRTVRPNSYRTVPGNHGRVTDLYTNGGSFWAATTEGYGQLRMGQGIVASSVGDLIIGQGDLLSEPVFYNEGITEGLAGLKNKNHAINTQYGRFWIDQDGCKIYRQQGGRVEEISNVGMSNFLKENLGFCTETDCTSQQVKGTSYYALGVDPRYNRLLVTKNDGNPKGSFTLSYDLERGVWVSFHSYIPRNYLWDRKTMYSLGDGGIWEHNCDCTYQTYYGKYYPHILEYTTVAQDIDTFIHDYTVLNTEAEECAGCYYIEDLDTTFNKIAVYNSTQSTGTRNVKFDGDNLGAGEDIRERIEEDSNTITLHKECRMWRFNDICDMVDRNCECRPMLTGDDCQPICDINESIIDCESTNRQDFYNRKFADKYLTYRLTFDVSDKINLNTLYSKTYGTDTECSK